MLSLASCPWDAGSVSEVLRVFAAAIATCDDVDGDVRRWVSAGLLECSVHLIAATYGVTRRVAHGVAAGAPSPPVIADEDPPFESVEHCLRIVACALETLGALLRVDP